MEYQNSEARLNIDLWITGRTWEFRQVQATLFHNVNIGLIILPVDAIHMI